MRESRRWGCLGPIFLVGLGVVAGIVGGVVLPEGGRLRVTARLPRWLVTENRNPEVAPAPSATATPSTPAPLAAITPLPTPAESARPLPDSLVLPKTRDTARLYNGLRVHAALDTTQGQAASVERETPDDYALDLRLQVKVPVPMRTLAELSRRSPTLGAALPKLPVLLEKAEVSKYYFAVYANKTELLRQNLTHLDALLGRDLFYDTDTILELQDPDSKRKALLIQSDMDVDTDGSDPERWNDIDANDPTFQPLTNYRWIKRMPSVVSPLVKIYQDRIDKLEAETRTPNARKNAAASLQTLREELYGVEHYSSLIARNDPYVVLPSFMVRGGGPQIGDYVVVAAGNQLYPAIFGDKGPNHLLGEASIRLAQAVDPRASATRSPVDDLKITYLVFPGTAEQPFGPPDLGHIRQRCQELLNEIGGNRAELHEWPSLLPPPPTPPPTPTPSPTAALPASPSPATAAPSTTASASPAPAKIALSPSPPPTPTPAKP